MRRKRKRDGTSLWTRVISMLLAAISVLGVVPFTPFVVSASAAEWEPDDTSSWTEFDNPILDALFYLDCRGGLNPGVRESLLNATLYYNSNTGSKHGNTTEIEHTTKCSCTESSITNKTDIDSRPRYSE